MRCHEKIRNVNEGSGMSDDARKEGRAVWVERTSERRVGNGVSVSEEGEQRTPVKDDDLR